MTIITDPLCTSYETPGHPERPSRIRDTVKLLKTQTELPLTWASPITPPEPVIQRAHTARHIARLMRPEDFDADTAFHDGINERARASVGAALAALDCALAERSMLISSAIENQCFMFFSIDDSLGFSKRVANLDN